MKLFSAKATYAAIAKTYSYLTPDLWKETLFQKSPYQEYSDYLQKNHRPVGTQKQQVKCILSLESHRYVCTMYVLSLHFTRKLFIRVAIQ